MTGPVRLHLSKDASDRSQKGMLNCRLTPLIWARYGSGVQHVRGLWLRSALIILLATTVNGAILHRAPNRDFMAIGTAEGGRLLRSLCSEPPVKGSRNDDMFVRPLGDRALLFFYAWS